MEKKKVIIYDDEIKELYNAVVSFRNFLYSLISQQAEKKLEPDMLIETAKRIETINKLIKKFEPGGEGWKKE